MMMRAILALSVLHSLALTTMVAGVPLDIASRLRAEEAARMQLRARDPRRIGGLDTSAGPHEYMRQLFSKLTDENGSPKNPAADPTNIWCLFDRDVRDVQYREPLQTRNRCSTRYRFVFDWDSLGKEELFHSLPLDKAIVRTYLRVIQRLVVDGKRVPVVVSAEARSVDGQVGSERIELDTLSVGANSSGWLELNITAALAAVWPPKPKSTVEVDIELRVDCHEHRKVPGSLIDPASISLSNQRRRERRLPLQPILLVFLTDEDVRERVEQDKIVAPPEDDLREDENLLNETDSSGARRRRTVIPSCGLETFRVTFGALRMENVIAPLSYDAGKCSGPCNHNSLRHNPLQSTNHAKLMASAHILKEQYGVLYLGATKDPCCVPTSYYPIGLLTLYASGLKYEIYPSMMAVECGCR